MQGVRMKRMSGVPLCVGGNDQEKEKKNIQIQQICKFIDDIDQYDKEEDIYIRHRSVR
jgi:hypothetical protein